MHLKGSRLIAHQTLDGVDYQFDELDYTNQLLIRALDDPAYKTHKKLLTGAVAVGGFSIMDGVPELAGIRIIVLRKETPDAVLFTHCMMPFPILNDASMMAIIIASMASDTFQEQLYLGDPEDMEAAYSALVECPVVC